MRVIDDDAFGAGVSAVSALSTDVHPAAISAVAAATTQSLR
jgi:hypothetical protein